MCIHFHILKILNINIFALFNINISKLHKYRSIDRVNIFWFLLMNVELLTFDFVYIRMEHCYQFRLSFACA